MVFAKFHAFFTDCAEFCGPANGLNCYPTQPGVQSMSMSALPLVPCLSLIMLFMGISESALHRKRLAKIPIRILVNGTRGKSTVTRLIAAGLRGDFREETLDAKQGNSAGKQDRLGSRGRTIRTIAKTTGTEARRILPDGAEEPLARKGPARISEQIAFVKHAAKTKAEAIVVECMAVTPENQLVFERHLNRSTIGVLTNVRLDHTDVMGQDEFEIARTLALSIPERAVYIANPGKFEDFFRAECEKRSTRFIAVNSEAIPDHYMAKFSYPMFRDNLAVALAVLQYCGIDEETAIARMSQARADPGVVPVQTMVLDGKTMVAVNAFAANDAESTLFFWQNFGQPLKKAPQGGADDIQESSAKQDADTAVAILSHRSDRPFRIRELWDVVSRLPVQKVLFCGDLQSEALRFARRHPAVSEAGSGTKQRAQPLPELICCGAAVPGDILKLAVKDSQPGTTTLLFMAGNMKGAGMELTRFIHDTAEASEERKIP